MIKKIIKFIPILLIISFIVPNIIFAQGGVNQTPPVSGGVNQTPQTVTLKNPLKPEINSVGAIVSEGVKIFSYVVVLFAVIVLIWVGLKFILARGNAEELKKLKLWLTLVVVGVAIVIGARIIIELVINTLSSTNLVNQNVIQSANQAIRGQ